MTLWFTGALSCEWIHCRSVNVNVQGGMAAAAAGGSSNWAKLSAQSAEQSFCPDWKIHGHRKKTCQKISEIKKYILNLFSFFIIQNSLYFLHLHRKDEDGEMGMSGAKGSTLLTLTRKTCICNFAFEECLKKAGSLAVRTRGSAALKLSRQLEISSIILRNILHATGNIAHYSQKYFTGS